MMGTNSRQRSKETTLYHYTNAQGLVGILNTQTAANSEFAHIHLSNIKQLNDSREYEEGKQEFNKLSSEINQLRSGAKLTTIQLQEFNKKIEILKAFEASGLHGVPNAEDHIFVCSLSKARDDLGQWRGYTKDNDAYSIGFNRDLLNAYLKREKQKYLLLECVYRKAAKGRIAADLLNHFIIDDLLSPGKTNKPSRLIGNLIDSGFSHGTIYRTILTLFKDEGFASEKEVRIICTNVTADEMFFISSSGLAKAKAGIRIPLSIIDEILIGPSTNPNTREQSVRLLLNKLSPERHIPISVSNLSYRPML